MSERGSVTAEFAIALPAVILVFACCLSGMRVAGAQLQLQDAAAAAARALARGEPTSVVTALAPQATVQRDLRGELLCATLTAPADWPIPLELSATSCALDGGR